MEQESNNKNNNNHIEDEDNEKPDHSELEQSSTIQKKQRLMPKRGEYRMRAHINPLNDTPFPYPLNPDYVNWKIHYPKFFDGTDEENQKVFCNTNEHPQTYDEEVNSLYNGLQGAQPVFLDIGCGFGGLVFNLAKNFPEKLVLGLEIRDKLVNYVSEKIKALRIESPDHKYNNAACIRTNAMRHIIQYFRKGTIEKMFFCFADPHFKKSNHRRRIINTGFLSEYAFLLKPKGRIYCITDVEDLHNWQEEHLAKHRMFRKLSEEELVGDICVQLIQDSTEEGQKVTRNGGKKWTCVFERV
ncbi:tRNA (guanine-N(7))-methyltransferase (macronuclear) [Tetrahymena thermophila SB210]|uniref:tRNA (guanine-N(7)-)-methyltransferase n=1 Tax=Tetrahymena thermophila (strain SB210) TaxID=312017 RepID=Q23MB9_TETTS|nr:tRNA (guanine-N(7))-methyltransferase [Tetrahymena thermophila SB210]EAR97720.2 tRNA (guanine-N(7))-methyltransferase [Tetrahymena thermophila SB210]|eukprot:XP_001017965.2 tRNA (guanine-N(7))-methyltransferase [Tetrahymena thermophila SB210]